MSINDDLIRGRRGETINVNEYPTGFMENLNDRLAHIDNPDRDQPFDRLLTVASNALLIGAGVLFLLIAGVQVYLWMGGAPL